MAEVDLTGRLVQRHNAQRLAVAATAFLTAVLLSGCTSGPTADASAVVVVVADTVEAQVHVRPEVNCGPDRLSVADGSVIDCTITDPGSNLTHDARIDIINPDGGDQFMVSLDVANDPKP